MATFPLALVVPLLLFFTLSPLSSHCANNIESGLAVPSPVTPKAAAIQYWYANVRNNKPPPHVFLSKLSSLPPLELLITDSDNMKSFEDAKRLENLFEERRHKVVPPLSWNWNSNDPSKEPKNLYEELRQKILSLWSRDHKGPSKESEDRYAELRQKKPPVTWNWDSSKEAESLYEELRQKLSSLRSRDHNGPSKESEDRYAKLRQKKPPVTWNWDSSKEAESLYEELRQKIPSLRSGDHSDPSKESKDRYVELRQKKPPVTWNWDNSKEAESLYEEAKQKIPSLWNHDHSESEDRYAKLRQKKPSVTWNWDNSKEAESLYEKLRQKISSLWSRDHNGPSKESEDRYAKLRQKKPPVTWNWDSSKEAESLYEELRQKISSLRSRDHNDPSKESEDSYAELRQKKPPVTWNWDNSKEAENHEGLQKKLEKDDKNGYIHTDTVIDPLGVYFKVSDLRQGNIMRFVDFRDYFPQQYFLPRTLASKMPFNSAAAIKKMFHIMPADIASKNVDFTVKHCNMPPKFPGEIRQCIMSAEDLIDFVIKGLETDNIEARSTESTRGCSRDVLIGGVKLVSEGNALSCHQVEFPYLVYHCHVVSKTRAYEVEILDVESKEKINHATVTCHMDTSMWTPTHEAFRALKSEPGKTEVCHFISKWDILWTSAADVVIPEA
ncbi:BURP domain-containing protein 9-like isoform X2 [Asparagus officinalis]|uniref:BURP domain-containing protein 9-like isoform X2 n=1 Tax=Asparagus officinalis TaxID=4686 RepID=UPI00098E5332|nr:BURP domain-containing protein 9-like isoform X2 [Asparagus officinalis]